MDGTGLTVEHKLRKAPRGTWLIACLLILDFLGPEGVGLVGAVIPPRQHPVTCTKMTDHFIRIYFWPPYLQLL